MQSSILYIIPYDQLYPPVNGGMLRCFNLLAELCKYYKVTAIINQNKQDFLKAVAEYPSIASAVIYSTADQKKTRDIFSFLPAKFETALRYRWYKRSLSGTADGHFLQYYNVLVSLLSAQQFDVAILEKLNTLNAVDVIRRYDKKITIIYDAHNVDTNLAKTLSAGHYDLIKAAESSLAKQVDAVIACSDADLEELQRLNEKRLTGTVIPNGVVITAQLYDAAVKIAAPEFLLFCGSLGYGPNTEGLFWFYEAIWPAIKIKYPQLKLMVVGSGQIPDFLKPLTTDPSVVFTGRVESVNGYYNQAALAIVPLKTGSGTRLKVLEAMSMGVPIVSTSKGAEGILYTDQQDILIADDPATFAASVHRLLTSTDKRLSVQSHARQLVEKTYDWVIIGRQLQLFIQSIEDRGI